MKSFWNSLTPIGRTIIAILIVVVVIVIAWMIYRTIKKHNETSEVRQVIQDAKGDLEVIQQQGQSPSFSSSTYQGTANSIQQLLDGCELSGTEIDVIKEIIKTVKNKADWYSLIIAFGSRDIADCGSFGFSSTNYDLISLLQDQLDTNQTYYTIDINGYKDSGAFTDSIDILTKYLNTIGINI